MKTKEEQFEYTDYLYGLQQDVLLQRLENETLDTDYLKAWQIAGEICDALLEDNINISARQHEKMAEIIHGHQDKAWDNHNQVWVD